MEANGQYSNFKLYAAGFRRPTVLYTRSSSDLSGIALSARVVDDFGGMKWTFNGGFVAEPNPSVVDFLTDFPDALLVTQLSGA